MSTPAVFASNFAASPIHRRPTAPAPRPLRCHALTTTRSICPHVCGQNERCHEADDSCQAAVKPFWQLSRRCQVVGELPNPLPTSSPMDDRMDDDGVCARLPAPRAHIRIWAMQTRSAVCAACPPPTTSRCSIPVAAPEAFAMCIKTGASADCAHQRVSPEAHVSHLRISLTSWLNHSGKVECDVCKLPFRFAPIYAPDMPDKIPFRLFVEGLWAVRCITLSTLLVVWADCPERNVQTFSATLKQILRIGVALVVWIVVVPLISHSTWRYYFPGNPPDAFGFVADIVTASSSIAQPVTLCCSHLHCLQHWSVRQSHRGLCCLWRRPPHRHERLQSS
jgi:hypothetical protein